MSSAGLATVSRFERKRLLDAEYRNRKSGEWGLWERIPLPNGVLLPGGGWMREIRAVHKNRVFAVLERPTNGARHLAVSSLSGIRPTWHEMQRIKNEIAGEEETAVEVYPPQKEMVDEADMFHIWVIPPLPFTIAYRDDVL